MILNGISNTREFVPTNQLIGSANKNNFSQILQSIAQSKPNNYHKSLVTTANRRISTFNKALNSSSPSESKSANSSVDLDHSDKPTQEMAQQNDGIKHDNKVQESEKAQENNKTQKSKRTQKSDNEEVNTGDGFLEIENLGEETQQPCSLISPQLIQQFEELLALLNEDGYLTEDETKEIAIKLETVTSLNEGTLLIDEYLKEHDIKVVELLSYLKNSEGSEKLEKLEKFEKNEKIIIDEPTKVSDNQVNSATLEAQNNMNPRKVDTEKEEGGFSVQTINQDDITDKPSQKFLDKQDVNVAIETGSTENPDITEPYTIIDLSKSFEFKTDNNLNQSFNTKEIFGKNLIEELIHKVEGTYKVGKNQFKLQLMPENLGKLSINLSSENHIVKAKVYVESLQVKESIESNLNQFKESLREKGINIGNVEVSVGQDPEAFHQNRSLMQQKIKFRRSQPNFKQAILGTQELDIITTTNPYLVATGFDKFA